MSFISLVALFPIDSFNQMSELWRINREGKHPLTCKKISSQSTVYFLTGRCRTSPHNEYFLASQSPDSAIRSTDSERLLLSVKTRDISQQRPIGLCRTYEQSTVTCGVLKSCTVQTRSTPQSNGPCMAFEHWGELASLWTRLETKGVREQCTETKKVYVLNWGQSQ